MSDPNNNDNPAASDYFPAYQAQLKDDNKRDEWGRQFPTMNDVYVHAKKVTKTLDGMPKPPEKEGEYEFRKPEGVEVNPGTEKWFRKTAFGLKIPKETAGKLFDEFNKMVGGQLKAQGEQTAKEAEEADKAVHSEWGENDYEANMKLADKGIADVGGEDLLKLLEEKGLKNNITVLKAFKQIGYEHGDDYIREGDVKVGKGKEGVDYDEIYPSMQKIPKRREF